MGWRRNVITLGWLILLLTLGAGQSLAAGIGTIDNLSGKLTAREIADRVEAYKTAAAVLEQSLEKLTSAFDMSTPDKMGASLQATRKMQEQLTDAQKAVAAVSDYLALNGSTLKDGARYLPLAYLKEQVEAPYHRALDSFLTACRTLLEFTFNNFGEISTGMQPQRSSYEEFYNVYIAALGQLNEASVAREKTLGEWLKRHPDLRESLPH